MITFHQIKNIHTTTSDNQNLSVFENVNVKILVFFYRYTQYLVVTPEATVKRICCFGNFLGPFRFPRKPRFNKSLLAATQRAGQQILRLPISFKNVFLCSLLEELLQQPSRGPTSLRSTWPSLGELMHLHNARPRAILRFHGHCPIK